MMSDFERGRGFALIDPHGDLALSIARATPKHRIPDTIYFDPLDTHVVVHNPVVSVPGLHRGTVAAHIVSSFKHIWAESWGPRLEYILTNAVRLLLENQGCSLTDIPQLLVDKAYRSTLLKKCDDPYIKIFWTAEYAAYSERLLAEAIAPIQNKVGQFANNPILRAVLEGKPTLNIPDVMNTRKVLLCNLSKRMGDEPSRLLGALLVTAFAQAAQARADMPEDEREDFTLYVDEFQNFATPSFASILSEAAKFRLNLVVANQFMGQVPEMLRHAVIGNVGTLAVFRIGSFDAPIFAKELNMSERELIDLPNRVARVKTMNGDTTTEAMRINTLPPQEAGDNLAKVQNNTRSRYARLRQ
jgi:hypothetical protein